MARNKRWLILSAGVLILAVASYCNRQRLQRAVVAISIYRAHIFTPPPTPRESRWRQLWDDAQFYWDFSEIHIARESRLKLLDPTLQPLVKEMGRRQATGEGMQYSMHIYREIRWRLNFTPDIETTRARIVDLRQSLAEPEEKGALAGQQQESDGSWALGINVWYLKLYYSVDHVLECTETPQYALSYLDRINSPEKLDARLDADLHDDFTKTGVFNREELDETFSAMARMLFRNTHPGCYAFDPHLGDALVDFVNRWQNPASGYWGQWMVDRQGRVWKMDDMAMTFHVVSDLNGHVNHLDRIAKRTLQLDSVNFPAGIRFNGHYENHLNWDVVKILRLAWPTLDEPTRQQAGRDIPHARLVLDPLLPAGRLIQSQRSGRHARRRLRVWRLLSCGNRLFPAQRPVLDRPRFSPGQSSPRPIEARLTSIGLNDPRLKEAYDTLQSVK